MKKANMRKRTAFWQIAGLAFLFIIQTQPAHAVLANWGAMICAFSEQNSAWPVFISWVAYTIGTFFIYKTLLTMRLHTEEPGRHPFHKIMLYAFTGAACLVFPSFVKMLTNTIGNGAVAVGGGLNCTPGAVVAAPGPVGLDTLANNLVGNITQPAFFALGLLCYCLGAFFILRGLNKMSKYNTDPRSYSMQAIVANFFIGALFMGIGRAKDMLMASVFGLGAGPLTFVTAGNGTIDWAALGIPPASATSFDTAFIAAVTFFQIIGLIAFIRGWLIAKAIAEGVGQHTTGQAVTHVLGGVLCMNLIWFLRAAQATFGLNFLT